MPGINSIQGLASNLDIASIVDTYIQYERIPVTFMEQDKDFKVQQMAAYQAILAKFIALQTEVSQLKKAASFDKADIAVSDETVLTATSGSNIGTGSYNVRVLSLAANHQLVSHGFDDAETTIFGTGTIQLSIGEASLTSINIESGNNSLIGIKDAINNADIGITATVLNDGSSSNPYRLMLSSGKTGLDNDINLTMNLTGGTDMGFTTGIFDNPEDISVNSSSTSSVSLAATADYTGTTNKTYTFTVGGSGTQTIGEDNITIYWDDGNQSAPLPSILVTGADETFELVGTGSDGLRLTFSAGTLTAGDTFQVTAFGPTLQEAADAKISVGGETSPIIVSADSNTFTDVLPGLTLNIKKVSDAGESVTISSQIDTAGIKEMVESFVSKYNDVMNFIDDQFTYDQDTAESGVLFADYSLQVIQSTVRSASTFRIDGLSSVANSLSAIGIRTGQNGQLSIANSSALIDAIKNNTDDFVKLFTDSGSSSSPYIEFLSTSENTVPGTDYEIEISQAATKGFFQGGSISSPELSPLTLSSNNNVIKLKVDGLISNDIVLTEKTYNSGSELASEIQTRIDADSKIGGKGLDVEWVDLGSTGYLKFTSWSYGSRSAVEMETTIANSGFSIMGLAGGMVHTGDDVAGTINGENATGTGQILAGNEDNPNTDGLKLRVTLTGNQLESGVEGTISVVKGLGSKLDETLENITKSIDGTIARRTAALNNQIRDINEQIEDYDERLAQRREDLYSQFLAMESALSEYQSEGSYLEQQLASIDSNWKQIKG